MGAGCAWRNAAAIGERCCVAFESSPQSEEQDTFYVTVSVGIAGTDTEGGDISTLLKSSVLDPGNDNRIAASARMKELTIGKVDWSSIAAALV